MFSRAYKFADKLYSQIKNIYNIKKIINNINKNSHLSLDNDIQQKNFQDLKNQIFSCGSLYIKFFQWYISKLKSNVIYKVNSSDNSSDCISDHFITYFEDIFEQCPYHDLEHTEETFLDMMDGVALKEYIDITTLKEIASGSIGQVYYAKRLDGTEIAIKVKHPDIDKELEEQSSLVTFIKWIQSIDFIRKKYSLFFNIDDFLNDINLQCDFNNEAYNSKQLAQYYEDSSRLIVFPKILFQSRDMLISEYIPAHAFETLTDFQKSHATLTFICFFYQMLLVDNLIHGDLHCKNWKVRISPDNNADVQLVIYDCGICFKNIDVELTRDFWFALGKYDIEHLCDTIKKFIVETKNVVIDEKINTEIKNILIYLEGNSLGTGVFLKSILNFFSSNDIIVHKFLLNLSILICVTEEFFKKTNIINSDACNLKEFNMYDLINSSHLDVIAFTETKNCFKTVGKIFKKDLDCKYQKYNNNIISNQIETNGKIIEKKLFSNLSSSKLKFNSPE